MLTDSYTAIADTKFDILHSVELQWMSLGKNCLSRNYFCVFNIIFVVCLKGFEARKYSP